jgi:hypothetical protein
VGELDPTGSSLRGVASGLAGVWGGDRVVDQRERLDSDHGRSQR